MNNIHNTNEQKNTARRGFASMPEERVRDIASKGGHVSAERAGHAGMAARGSKGGLVSAARAGYEGMAARGRSGGYASAESKHRRAEEQARQQKSSHLS